MYALSSLYPFLRRALLSSVRYYVPVHQTSSSNVDNGGYDRSERSVLTRARPESQNSPPHRGGITAWATETPAFLSQSVSFSLFLSVRTTGEPLCRVQTEPGSKETGSERHFFLLTATKAAEKQTSCGPRRRGRLCVFAHQQQRERERGVWERLHLFTSTSVVYTEMLTWSVSLTKCLMLKYNQVDVTLILNDAMIIIKDS